MHIDLNYLLYVASAIYSYLDPSVHQYAVLRRFSDLTPTNSPLARLFSLRI